MKKLDAVLKFIFGLLLLNPILGVTGIFPPPTPDLYNTPQAFAFIEMLMSIGYINWLIVIIFAIAIFLIVNKRIALAALIILPITVNIISFHLFLDGGLLSAGAIMADILFALNLYFLYKNRDHYQALWAAQTDASA